MCPRMKSVRRGKSVGKGKKTWIKRTALKHVYYQVWNRSAVHVGCMRQVLGAGALGWPRGMGWGGRWEGGSGWGTHVNPWLIHVNVWQKLLQYCKVISLQLIKINGKKKHCLSKRPLGEGNGKPPQCLAWRIPGTEEPGGLPSMGLHRVGHDWSDLAAAAARGLWEWKGHCNNNAQTKGIQ